MDNEAKSRPFFLLQFLSAEITATISPQVHVQIEKLANKAGAQSLEACMASSITQAREGKLYLICGGNEDAFRKAEPILKELAAQIRFVGKAGEAAKVKTPVNMVMNINTAGLAEGLGLGAALGLDLTILREVFSQTGANSRVLETERRRHAKSRGQLLFLRRARREGQRNRARTRAQSQSRFTARARHKGTIRPNDCGRPRRPRKSGIAELTFKDRHKLPAIACDSFGTVEPSGPAKPKTKIKRILLQSL